MYYYLTKSWLRISAALILVIFLFTSAGITPAFAKKAGRQSDTTWLNITSQVLGGAMLLTGLSSSDLQGFGSKVFVSFTQPLAQAALHKCLREAGLSKDAAGIISPMVTAGTYALFTPTLIKAKYMITEVLGETDEMFREALENSVVITYATAKPWDLLKNPKEMFNPGENLYGMKTKGLISNGKLALGLIAREAITAGVTAAVQLAGRNNLDCRNPAIAGLVDLGAVFIGSGVQGSINYYFLDQPLAMAAMTREEIFLDFENKTFLQERNERSILPYTFLNLMKDPTKEPEIDSRGNIVSMPLVMVKEQQLKNEFREAIRGVKNQEGRFETFTKVFLRSAMTPGVGFYVSSITNSFINLALQRAAPDVFTPQAKQTKFIYTAGLNGIGLAVGALAEKASYLEEGEKLSKEDWKNFGRRLIKGTAAGMITMALQAYNQKELKMSALNFNILLWTASTVGEGVMDAVEYKKSKEQQEPRKFFSFIKDAYARNSQWTVEHMVTWGKEYPNIKAGLGNTALFYVQSNAFSFDVADYGWSKALENYTASKIIRNTIYPSYRY